jgi:dTDP-4-amino-4,6-dideoxygalactose transaminase
MFVSIARPAIGEEELAAAVEVLRSGQLVQGERVAEFERAFASFHGAAHGVATSSGSTALIAALMAHGVGPGDEVIIPSFSFVATATAVLFAGARPVFADIDPLTFCLSVEAAARAVTARTKAIMPVHLFGHPADLPAFRRLCDERGLVLLEDAAQAHGATIAGRPVGAWGTGAFSFHASKNITTMEGGMVLTGDAEVAARLRLVRQHGMRKGYVHETLGTNFRLTELAAAIGLVQLGRLAGWQRARTENASHYARSLRGVVTPSVAEGVVHAFHQYTVRVPEPVDRDRVVAELNARGIEARVYYPHPIHEQAALGAHSVTNALLPETARAAREVLSIPVHPGLSVEERAHVVESVNAVCAP